MKIRTRKKLHPTGQLSIFVILIFQTLFVLFAMSLNIALVVHDKINLQNSVDLAAYYGAMKQAEMMNAVAHINYQIRQSWKLLTWRYRVLGNIGRAHYGAFQSDREHLLPTYTSPPLLGPYFFCVGHNFWGGFVESVPPLRIGSAGNGRINTDTDNLCSPMDRNIPAITVPRVVGTLGSLAQTLYGIRDLGTNINTALSERCTFYGYNSWLLGIMSFFHFRRDQSARKFMIKEIAQKMAEEKDLDGDPIREGVIKTFEKNLSFINKQSFRPDQLKQFNSLEGTEPQDWLKDNPFYVWGLYSKFTGGNAGCRKEIGLLTHNPPEKVKNHPSTLNLIDEIFIHGDEWPCNNSQKCEASAGLEKDPDFIIFYSVKAELEYKKQIFLPFSQNIKLKAKAFAKPFGGRIGPPLGTDKLLPRKRLPPNSALAIDRGFSPNYSRYPGDPWGLRSKSVHYYWANYIKNRPKSEKDVNFYTKVDYMSPPDNDPMARGGFGNGTDIKARQWEWAAIAPDLFDVTYFTILPYYTEAYFPKIKILLNNHPDLRGDLGIYKVSAIKFTGKSLLYQISNLTKPDVWERLLSLRKPFYKIKKPEMLLTGWNPPTEKYTRGDNDYDDPRKTHFVKCQIWAKLPLTTTTRGQIANGCVYGGRTGYSVKMISENFLRGFNNATNDHPPPPWYTP